MKKTKDDHSDEFLEAADRLGDSIVKTGEITDDNRREFVQAAKKAPMVRLLAARYAATEDLKRHQKYCPNPSKCLETIFANFLQDVTEDELKRRGVSTETMDEISAIVNDSDGVLDDDDNTNIAPLDLQKTIGVVAAGRFLNSLIWAVALVAIAVIIAVALG